MKETWSSDIHLKEYRLWTMNLKICTSAAPGQKIRSRAKWQKNS